MRWLDRLERRYGARLKIHDLMLYICASMACVLGFELLMRFPISNLFFLNFGAVLSGQIWRLVTFVFLPPSGSGILISLIAIYFYYYMGSSLERVWGAFRFNVYYICGLLGAVIAAMITGFGDNTYLNLSLFLAYAMLFPEQQVLLFFIFPIKVKYLAWLDWALFLFSFITGPWSTKAAIAASLINFFIFFGPDLFRRVKNDIKYSKQRRNWRNNNNNFH